MKHRSWSRRPPRDTETYVDARLGVVCVLFAQLSPRANAATLGIEISGCTELERTQALLVVHIGMCFATL